ncbi:MAG: hypothetical protein FWF22_06155 [Treponema sp.]|nr:hypothetical protein [Treponema sp.]
MTLTNRNRCFKAGIVLSSLSLIIIAAAAFIILPVYPSALNGSVRSTAGFYQQIAEKLLKSSPYVPFVSMAAAVVYSLAGIILITYFFRQTKSPEIIFVGLFIISMAFECIRIIIPLKLIMDLPNIYLTNSSRIILFGRYFGLFSLFAASVYTAGLEVQKQQYVILICFAASLILAMGVPVDGLSWDSTLIMLNDFNTTFIMIQAGIIGITIVSFLISAYTRGSKDYIFIGIGALLAFFGRNILFSADTWASPAPGLIILSVGTWMICTRFHHIYLWL